MTAPCCRIRCCALIALPVLTCRQSSAARIAGFIGSAVIRYFLDHTEHQVINLDKLTYAGDIDSIPHAVSNPRYCLEQVDISDSGEVTRVFQQHQPGALMHLAAESLWIAPSMALVFFSD
jgi:UDP-glucose 4-epimerase